MKTNIAPVSRILHILTSHLNVVYLSSLMFTVTWIDSLANS